MPARRFLLFRRPTAIPDRVPYKWGCDKTVHACGVVADWLSWQWKFLNIRHFLSEVNVADFSFLDEASSSAKALPKKPKKKRSPIGLITGCLAAVAVLLVIGIILATSTSIFGTSDWRVTQDYLNQTYPLDPPVLEKMIPAPLNNPKDGEGIAYQIKLRWPEAAVKADPEHATPYGLVIVDKAHRRIRIGGAVGRWIPVK